MEIFTGYISSPIGTIEVVCNDKCVLSVDFVETIKNNTLENDYLRNVLTQLEQYFLGARKSFDINIHFEGTEFQKKVWNELTKIPYGTVISYKELANRIGNPKSMRAVGNANRNNKISIIVPCHRVIGASGKLIGYAGGLDRKKWLLEHEQKNR
ncbi:methylated-DNA--[protein]-cysteine S-methyltransferase [Caldicellulosiruptoraceae bacterium PP1]